MTRGDQNKSTQDHPLWCSAPAPGPGRTFSGGHRHGCPDALPVARCHRLPHQLPSRHPPAATPDRRRVPRRHRHHPRRLRPRPPVRNDRIARTNEAGPRRLGGRRADPARRAGQHLPRPGRRRVAPDHIARQRNDPHRALRRRRPRHDPARTVHRHRAGRRYSSRLHRRMPQARHHRHVLGLRRPVVGRHLGPARRGRPPHRAYLLLAALVPV